MSFRGDDRLVSDYIESEFLHRISRRRRTFLVAQELHLSRHTIKSEVVSIDRKLGASSRSEAVDKARELALLDS